MRLLVSVCGKAGWRWLWVASVNEFHEDPPENAAPALYGSQLRRRSKVSQKLCQIGKFFSDLLRLRMAAAVEESGASASGEKRGSSCLAMAIGG